MTLARESTMDLPLHQVRPFYRAMKAFNAILYRQENLVQLKMKPGEMFALDNRRVLHGRSAFSATGGTSCRHLQGGFLDWDEVYSRMRVLQAELGILE
ncbi:gamma-butyrobetaine dioxygenase-like isoform X2 [Branchiostoma floridae x Branchiostoma japonicum]